MTAHEQRQTATFWVAIFGIHRDFRARPILVHLLWSKMMMACDARFWNLAQAAAWAVYREREPVEQFAKSDEAAYTAIGFYPTMWPPWREEYLPLSALHDAFSEGRLKSEGYHRDRPDKLARIPAADWNILDLHPPLAFNRRYPGKRQEPWTEIHVASADAKRLWRSLMETSGRTKFDWAAIWEIYRKAQHANPEFSQNELIMKVQGAFEEKFKKTAPSRSAFQRQIKKWK